MVRILIYPNITFPRDLTKDSYVQFLRKFMLSMKYKRDDIYWYCVVPKYEGKQYQQTKAIKRMLSFPNTKFLEIEIPRAPFNRIHYDFYQMKKIINWREYTIDLIFSNLPELTQNLKVFFDDETNTTPQVFGYSHWFDFQKQVTHHSSFLPNMIGVLQMDVCYCNTQSQKDMVLEEAKKHFNKETLKILDEKLVVFKIPVISTDVRINPNMEHEKIIVFNHRPSAEKSFNQFVKSIDKLYQSRKDFKVWVPLLKTKLNKDWLIDIPSSTKREYYDGLRRCCVGVSPKQKYSGWSISTTDGLMCGVPYIMYDADYYKELNPTSDFYSNESELIDYLNKYLDSKRHRNTKVRKALKHMDENLVFEKNIDMVSNQIDVMMDKVKPIGGEKIFDFIKFIKSQKRVTHKDFLKHFTWGRAMKFNSYRKRILDEKGISEVKGEWKTIYEYK